MVHHDLQALALSQLNQLLGLLRSRRKRLFDENMLAVLQGGFCQFEVGPDRSDDGNRIDLGRSQDLRNICGELNARKASARAAQRGRILIADRDDLTAIQIMNISGYVRAPISVSNHAHANQIGRSGLWVALVFI